MHLKWDLTLCLVPKLHFSNRPIFFIANDARRRIRNDLRREGEAAPSAINTHRAPLRGLLRSIIKILDTCWQILVVLNMSGFNELSPPFTSASQSTYEMHVLQSSLKKKSINFITALFRVSYFGWKRKTH